MSFKKGQFIEINNRLAIVCGVEGEDDFVPEGHTALWYGDIKDSTPEIWTVPTEYCSATKKKPKISH